MPEKTEIFLLPADTKEVELSLTKLPEGVSDDPYNGWVTIRGWPDDSNISLDARHVKIQMMEIFKFDLSIDTDTGV